jgi:hypothetical protein
VTTILYLGCHNENRFDGRQRHVFLRSKLPSPKHLNDIPKSLFVFVTTVSYLVCRDENKPVGRTTTTHVLSDEKPQDQLQKDSVGKIQKLQGLTLFTVLLPTLLPY